MGLWVCYGVGWLLGLSFLLQIGFYSFPGFPYLSRSITMGFGEDDDWEDEDFDEDTDEGNADF